MPYKNNNVASGIPKNSPYQVGKSDIDSPSIVLEKGELIPWPSDPDTSWVYFNCTVGVMLDSGIVVHNRLPQVNNAFDTLSAGDIDSSDFSTLSDIGVNLKCRDQYADIVQRMGHARYWFRLWGEALRVGFKVPIPGLRTIGGVLAIPYDQNPQWAFNRVFPGGNYSGVVLWHAQWSLWYTTAVPPTSQDIPTPEFAAHIDGDIATPKGMQSPFSQPDDDAVPSKPATRQQQTIPQQGGSSSGSGGRLGQIS